MNLKPLTPLFYVLSAFLIALGFNTLDAMINTFYWQPWRQWYPNGSWIMTPFNTPLNCNWWLAYILYGILPLSLGNLMLGYLLGRREK